MKDIHDIRPPVFAGFDPGIIDILLIILALVAIVAFIWIIFNLYKKRSLFKKNKNTLLLPSPLPAEEIALQELKLITDLMEKNRRLFYFKLTAILKNYISKKFSINAREMTSQELIKSINVLDIKSSFFILISKFFKFSDNIKYAAMPASTQEVKEDFNLIKEFIKTTSKKQNEYLEKETN